MGFEEVDLDDIGRLGERLPDVPQPPTCPLWGLGGSVVEFPRRCLPGALSALHYPDRLDRAMPVHRERQAPVPGPMFWHRCRR